MTDDTVTRAVSTESMTILALDAEIRKLRFGLLVKTDQADGLFARCERLKADAVALGNRLDECHAENEALRARVQDLVDVLKQVRGQLHLAGERPELFSWSMHVIDAALAPKEPS